MYTERLEQLGAHTTGRIHSTQLKNIILTQFPELKANKHGRDVLLAFNEDIAAALNRAHETDYDDEAIVLAQASQIVRRDMLNMKSEEFSGIFELECQHDSIPQSLVTLVKMILGGPSISMQSCNIVENQAVLSIAQLLLYNSTVRRRTGSAAAYHTRKREPPLPIYTGLLLHAETRKRGLIDKLNSLGLSVSYDRVMELSTDIGNGVCDQFEKNNLVCPPKLRCGLFTTSAVDNIDHNPSSTTALGSFHGTGISLFQHPTAHTPGHKREVVINQRNKQMKISPLPDKYSNVPPVILCQKQPSVPQTTGQIIRQSEVVTTATKNQTKWMDHVEKVQKQTVAESQPDMNISWAAFHASESETLAEKPTDLTAMLPLFPEEAKSPAMIKHAMDIIKQSVHFLNPGQVPVIACDQPLFALAKTIQWNWPETHGENHCFIMFWWVAYTNGCIKDSWRLAAGQWMDNSYCGC